MFERRYVSNPRRFCQSRTLEASQQFVTLRFVVRKTFNQDILRFRVSRTLLDTRLHG